MTREQYEYLEAFGLNMIDTKQVDVKKLRKAAHDAVLVIHFKDVEGMEEYSNEVY